MALFGAPSAFLGIDIGSSSLKLVELINRRRRIEVATYAQASLPNLLIAPGSDEKAAISRVADTVAAMMNRAGVSADAVVAALPSSIVFSTVLTLPSLPDKEIDKAVHFAARDVVPADLDEMVLGWSRVGETPHMDTDLPADSPAEAVVKAGASPSPTVASLPVFVTAAPKDIVARYLRVMEVLHLNLQALEVETFPLVRSLFENPAIAEGLIIDIGDLTTTFHIVDSGTPRASHTLETGGNFITNEIATALKITPEEAEKLKVTHGAGPTGGPELEAAAKASLEPLLIGARQFMALYASQNGRQIRRSLLIGGGANLKGLPAIWEEKLGHKAFVGNPWRGLAYPQALESRLNAIGPTYAVAVGLAERGARGVQ